MSLKNYVSLESLRSFLDNLKITFAPIYHKHAVSDLTDYTVDTEFSSVSTNPVQNKVIDAEFEAVSTAMSSMEATIGVINEFILNHHADWKEVDETSPAYIRNKPDENDAMELIAEMGLIEPTVDENGAVYTDENGVIYTL